MAVETILDRLTELYGIKKTVFREPAVYRATMEFRGKREPISIWLLSEQCRLIVHRNKPMFSYPGQSLKAARKFIEEIARRPRAKSSGDIHGSAKP